MIKLSTDVVCQTSDIQLSLEDRVMVLGSCFSDELGAKFTQSGFNICVNPFGTLYNPASLAASVSLLSDDAILFTEEDCIQMGAGSEKICSFRHHTSFARPSAEEFLSVANDSLKQAREFWRTCNKLVITLGTAFVWEHKDKGIVSNCLKRNASEFAHRMMGVEECRKYIQQIMELCGPERQVIFMVSPIRNMSLGAHNNTLSMSALHLALDATVSAFANLCAYFPAYEILNDELRDYRFYADDLLHPSSKAMDIIWEKFLNAHVPVQQRIAVSENRKLHQRSLHRDILK